MDYRELHRSARKLPYDDGKPFAYTAENRARLEEIGGLDGLKKWLLERRKLFELRDTLSAEIVPKVMAKAKAMNKQIHLPVDFVDDEVLPGAKLEAFAHLFWDDDLEFCFYGHDEAYRECHKIADELQEIFPQVRALKALNFYEISSRKTEWYWQCPKGMP